MSFDTTNDRYAQPTKEDTTTKIKETAKRYGEEVEDNKLKELNDILKGNAFPMGRREDEE